MHASNVAERIQLDQSNRELGRLAREQQALLLESRRRQAIRDRIEPAEKTTVTKPGRPSLFPNRLPASGNAALSASALIQAALGVEFTLAGLNKLADPHYVSDFAAFTLSSPGATSGILSVVVRALVFPHVALFARLIEVTELLLGIILLIGAIEIGRRRFSGRLGAQHRYEAPVALVASLAGLAAAGLTFSIAMLMGEGFPTITPGRAFTTAIPVELLIIPLGLAIAWLEFGRFLVLRQSPVPAAGAPARLAPTVTAAPRR